MANNRSMKRHGADLRGRGIITTVLLIVLAAMIVRDMLARRWAAPGVTYRSSYGSEKPTPSAPSRDV